MIRAGKSDVGGGKIKIAPGVERRGGLEKLFFIVTDSKVLSNV